MERKSTKRRPGIVSLALGLAVLFALFTFASTDSAYAATAYPTGTFTRDVSLIYQETDKDGQVKSSQAVSGAQFTVYKVLNLNRNLTYTPVDGLESVQYTFGKVDTQTADENQADATNFYNAIKQNSNIQPVKDMGGSTNSKGIFNMYASDGEYGVYLVVQTGSEPNSVAASYATLKPFLVQIPSADSNGWIREMTLNQKIQPTPPKTPGDNPPGEENPPGNNPPGNNNPPGQTTYTPPTTSSNPPAEQVTNNTPPASHSPTATPVKTGDVSDVAIFAAIILIAAGCIAILIKIRKKRS